ncbi:histone deacetylase 3 [Vairimorpha apis BRL 01]|uniref:histone deacetylase n=1 Tax=Vairimorpha apis BRL 01 TaxID=1037528 RepID=T0L258_9MICR|nr:histone deacetylase 3 [Vairimorpha apis BRL 01]
MRIGYIYDETVGLYHYGPKHPMKPFRLTVTHSLVKSLNLQNKMTILKPKVENLTYHTYDYFNNLGNHETSDCPSFIGLKDFCIKYSSATINAAKYLNQKDFEIVINWSGGLHHAHKYEPSGFCFVNDIVMGILELLNQHERVMYIDIDVHHGDGVEDAFFDNDRVLTCSFHKYGEFFFPESGPLNTTNKKLVNVPLLPGCDDESYFYIFKPIIDSRVKKFKPNVIVMQCGADSLGNDRIGMFNLSVHGHAACLNYVKNHNIPLMILGGGGYTLNNVARCWSFETAMICGIEPLDIPKDNFFYSFFSPDYIFNPLFKKNFENKNNKEYLDSLIGFICEKVDNW